MKRYFDLLLRGLPWALTTFTGLQLLVYLPKGEITLVDIIIGIVVFAFGAGPLFIVLKDRLGKGKTS